MNKIMKPRNQRGLSLIEILISILIASVLILVITSMYGNFISSSKFQEEQSNAQDQANFAFLYLNRAVRMAGAGLCVKPTVKSSTYLHQPIDFSSVFPPLLTDAGLVRLSPQSRLHSFPIAANTNGNRVGTSLNLVEGDALLVIYSDSHTRRVVGVVGVDAEQASRFDERQFAQARTPANDPVFNYSGEPGESNRVLQTTWVMMSDCNHTGVFRYSPDRFSGKAANILPTPDNDNFAYNLGAKEQNVLIAKLHAELYFVAKDDKGRSSLYVKDLLMPAPNNAAKPLALFVKKMKVEYKQGSNWVAAPSSWGDELPIRISLTIDAGAQLGEQLYTRVIGIRN